MSLLANLNARRHNTSLSKWTENSTNATAGSTTAKVEDCAEACDEVLSIQKRPLPLPILTKNEIEQEVLEEVIEFRIPGGRSARSARSNFLDFDEQQNVRLDSDWVLRSIS
jgi:hypothetical protein